MSDSLPVADPVLEARRVLDAAAAAGVQLRAVGGVAVRLRANGKFPHQFDREYGDIDLATPKERGRAVAELLGELGYLADQHFNALHGSRRLMFFDELHERHLDVFVGVFEMCHRLPLTARIDLVPLTVPSAELLLTKLQVVELNRKDIGDALALILAEPVRDDETGINADVIAELCSADWGLWRTCKQSLERLADEAAGFALDDESIATIRGRIAELWARIEAEPKSSKWRMRARIGDRKRWHEVPEETH